MAPPEASAAGPGALAADWLGLCRRVVEAQRRIFAEVRGIDARTVYDGVGEGGDHTLVIDRRCEDAVFEQLGALAREGHSFTAISEERGEVAFGDGGGLRVVIDPIDGSLNARRHLPSFSLSFAVATGPSMADVEFGYVFDFGAGEEFWARRGGGAFIGEEPLRTRVSERGLVVVGLESARPELAVPVLERLAGSVYRVRVVGSIAITVSYVAAGRLDGMLSLRPCRSVDAAAAQLIAQEAGAAVSFGPRPAGQTGLGLDERFPIAAAATTEGLATLRGAQGAAGGK
ncbi:MAG: inositol monophosphatase family protein [Solirubrobacterales bacterium]